ncbi:MAG: FG-GAP repeat protein [Alphaproteobacteria bacterium]|nr:FG-GAP repeat protein [Alphaproteobacteria bacterium]
MHSSVFLLTLLGACLPPEGWLAGKADQDADGHLLDEDCDGLDPEVYNGAPELCDGRDQDCDGEVDEGLEEALYYLDGDGDGFGAGASQSACAPPTASHVRDGTDCDDSDAEVHPGAEETWYNGVDEDCAGGDDYDADGDGVPWESDCLDSCMEEQANCTAAIAASVYPGADEVCRDGWINDCDMWGSAPSVLAWCWSGETTSDRALGVDEIEGAWTGHGTMEQGHLGRVGLAALGDLDGDGVPEVAAGADANGDDRYAGSVRVYSGEDVLAQEEATPILEVVGVLGDGAGYAITSIGSLLVVGAPFWETNPSVDNPYTFGAVYFFDLGRGAVQDLDQAVLKIAGKDFVDSFGYRLLTLPMEQGEALAIGAYRAGPDWSTDYHGAVFLITLVDIEDAIARESDRWMVIEDGDAASILDGLAEYEFEQSDPYSFMDHLELRGPTEGYAGASLAKGDLNGDGIMDLVIGAIGGGADGTRLESVYVVDGPIGDRVDIELGYVDLEDRVGDGVHRVDGLELDSSFGLSVSVVGDLDGFGGDDLLIGAYEADGHLGAAYVAFNEGDGVFSTHLLVAGTQEGSTANERVGFSVAAPGDVNGDGSPDLLVGMGWAEEWGAARFARLFLGPIGPGDLTGESREPDLILYNDVQSGSIGHAVAPAGDLDGDGYMDFLLGDPFLERNVNRGGAVHFIPGTGY